jgi:hypothetical protein
MLSQVDPGSGNNMALIHVAYGMCLFALLTKYVAESGMYMYVACMYYTNHTSLSSVQLPQACGFLQIICTSYYWHGLRKEMVINVASTPCR